jgi:hypothetical protein
MVDGAPGSGVLFPVVGGLLRGLEEIAFAGAEGEEFVPEDGGGVAVGVWWKGVGGRGVDFQEESAEAAVVVGSGEVVAECGDVVEVPEVGWAAPAAVDFESAGIGATAGAFIESVGVLKGLGDVDD